ncbi:MAG: class I SAM-dependent methyltransferase [Coriobacteriia bacterium]|nr:class I SAM-dependent methyltransferase [Coriobacteriia bacterium]
MRRRQHPLDDAALEAAAERYRTYRVEPLGYGTVRDFCDSFDHLRWLATANGDLKDLQRPWMLKAILSRVGTRGGRLLEIGAGEPLVADLLQRLGHDVLIIDPYDGSGNGPRDYSRFRRGYRNLNFIRAQFSDSLQGLAPASFDCIYSISVLEHIPPEGLVGVMAGMQRFLKPEGISLHAVDHVHRGRGAAEHLSTLRVMTSSLGFRREDLDHALTAMSGDVDTYYLSAESHNRWRGGRAYDEFPMRVCVSIQFCSVASSIVVE